MNCLKNWKKISKTTEKEFKTAKYVKTTKFETTKSDGSRSARNYAIKINPTTNVTGTHALNIHIHGSGYSGITAAIALLNKKIPVTVSQSKQAGTRCLILPPNAMRIFQSLGIDQQVISEGQILTNYRVTSKTNKTYGALNLQEFSSKMYNQIPFVAIREETLIPLLTSLLSKEHGRTLYKGQALVKRQHNSIFCFFADGRTKKTDIFIIADGAESEMRKHLMPQSESWKVRMTGYEYWSAYIPKPDKIAKGTYLEMWGPNKRLWIADCGNGLVHVSGTVLNTAFDIAKMLTPGLKELSRFHNIFAPDFIGEEIDSIFEFCTRNSDYKAVNISYPSVRTTNTDMVPTEFHFDGAVLIGDAAHSMYAPYGNNEALGIEDGYVLAKCISENTNPAEILSKYTALRKKRITAISQLSQKESSLAIAGRLKFIKKIKLAWKKNSFRLARRWKTLIDMHNVWP